MALSRVLAAAALALALESAAAGNEHERRLGAELLLLSGDARRLATESLPEPQRAGLRARVAGALSSLPLTLRRAGGDAADAVALREAAAAADWPSLVSAVQALRRRHPHDLQRIVDARASRERLRLGEAIHRASCAGCHDAPVRDTPLPARNLSEQFANTPRDEFAARLYLGVRGDRTTAYRNPFSDLELGALMVWYARAGQAGEGGVDRP